MVTKKLNKKNRQMDFFIDGKPAGSTALDPAEIAQMEATLRGHAHKYAALHG